jgi:outer membrane lipoprotein SlyB
MVALATVAGAVGGGYAGNVVEKRMRSTTVTHVRVRMKNGSVRSFSEPLPAVGMSANA